MQVFATWNKVLQPPKMSEIALRIDIYRKEQKDAGAGVLK
jgi:hypothetical protein